MGAWFLERFPPLNWLFVFTLYAAALFGGRGFSSSEAIQLSWADGMGFFVALAFFLTLRILDEHKDYDEDCRNHPDRVLQRGLTTLADLKVVGVLATLLQLGWSLFVDGGFGAAVGLWVVTLCWTGLMTARFFAGERLAQRPILNSALHLLVMPLAMAWLVQLSAGRSSPWPEAVWLAGFALITGAALEASRKRKRYMAFAGAAILLGYAIIIAGFALERGVIWL
jgi:hypothetical protein